jgi:hypothetical protein
MAARGSGWRRKQEEAISALLTHATIAEAATAIGVCERTLRGWLKESEFAAEYRAVRRQLVEHVQGRLQESASAATQVLRSLLGSDRDAVRLRAAEIILTNATRAVEQADMLERLEALEASLESKSLQAGRTSR